ncbi:uncharacterized protein LOC134278008 [Saccostrea cucullata]|uniref:uncharacterized protein LOC134278008 n=1 Tax=Saccostrea cuccullata TaxID=36930 RepID=UPI002ED54059
MSNTYIFALLLGLLGVFKAETSAIIENSKLGENILLTLDLIGQKMCVHQCFYHSDCKAVNFNKRQLTCDLLTRSGQEEPGSLQYDSDYIHIYNLSNDQISDFCANTSCPAHNRCVNGERKSLCVTSGCQTNGLTIINGNIRDDVIQVGSTLEYTCLLGYAKRNIDIRCLSSGKIENAEKVACFKMEGSWTIAFKIQSNSGAHPLNSFLDTGTQQERNSSFPSTCMTLTKVPECTTPYRTGLVDDWGQLGVQEIRFVITVNSTLTQEIVFDGYNSTNFDWFTGSRVKSSTWSDVTNTQTYLHFNLPGDQRSTITRLWTIIKSYHGCAGDIGWFLASFNPTGGCAFDMTSNIPTVYPAFPVCPKSTACYFLSETVEAETFAVLLKADKLS